MYKLLCLSAQKEYPGTEQWLSNENPGSAINKTLPKK
jgi:hypothetical protein